MTSHNFKDLTGQRFGRLTVIERAGKIGNFAAWKCKCDCGNEIILRGVTLGRSTNSCGCLHKEATQKHGLRHTRLYNIWMCIKARCSCPNNPAYTYYGGRGIIMCNEWKEDFKVFYDWAMENGYEDTLTIDRIDANRNYEPSNCRWATPLEQNRNKRDNHLITFNGDTKTITEWERALGWGKNVVGSRLRRGWSVEKALTTPPRKRK